MTDSPRYFDGHPVNFIQRVFPCKRFGGAAHIAPFHDFPSIPRKFHSCLIRNIRGNIDSKAVTSRGSR